MTAPTIFLSTHPDRAPHAAVDAPTPLYRPILAHALLLGVAGDVLLRPPGAGLSFPIWVAILALSAIALIWRSDRELPREAAFWLLSALLFSAFTVWRSSETLVVMDVLATLGSLAMAALAVGDDRAALFAERLRDTVWNAVSLARTVAAGLLPVAFRASHSLSPGDPAPHRARSALRATLFSVVLVVVFGSLLRSADPLFASFLDLPDFEVDELVSHILLIGFYSWLAAGWARSALRVDVAEQHAPDRLPVAFSALDVTAGLGTLLALFSLYVLSQLGWYFGGENFLRERTGLTAATYARQGFFQLVFVIALVLPVLMATRALMRPSAALARRHTMLALPIILLLGATMVSAVARLRLYVHFYGLTTDRLYPLVFMGWLAVVLIWFALTVLRDAPRPFVAGSILTGALTLVALNLSDPDAIVARSNLERGAQITQGVAPLDLEYLARLSGAAVPITVRALVASGSDISVTQRCAASRSLLYRWGAGSSRADQHRSNGAWRWWNADEAEAMRVVAANAGRLRAIAHGCPRRSGAG